MTVRLSVQPSSSALRVVKNDIEVKVQAQSSTRTTVPVQSVANGKVSLTMSLQSPTGVTISEPSTVELNVQAQWETVITAVAAVGLVGIFGFGIFRSIRKRIRRRNGEVDDDEDDPNRPLAVQPAAPGAPGRPGGTSAAAQAAAAPAVVGSTTSLRDPLPEPEAPTGVDPRLQADASHRPAAPTEPEEPTISTQQQPVVDAEPAAERSLGRASAMLAAGTMASRCWGSRRPSSWRSRSVRTSPCPRTAFAVANQLPNNIYAPRRGGLLSAVLIPQIVRSMKQHADGGTAYVNKIVTLGATVFVSIAVIATALAPLLVRLYTSNTTSDALDGAATDLAVAFAFWCLPQILFYAMYSLLGEVLNAKQVFGPFTWAPLLNNVIAVAGLVVFIALFGTDNSSVEEWTPLKIAVLAGSASLGVFAQASSCRSSGAVRA